MVWGTKSRNRKKLEGEVEVEPRFRLIEKSKKKDKKGEKPGRGASRGKETG